MWLAVLDNADFGTRRSFACEAGFLYLREGNDTVFRRVDSEVAADKRTRTCNFRATSLANENFTGRNSLATKALYTEALPGIVAVIFT